MNKNNKKLLIVVLVLTLVLVIGTTYAWLRLTKNSNTVNRITAGSLDIKLDEPTPNILLNNEVPKSYRQGIENKEYTFTLTNTSGTSDYKISLEDINVYVDENSNEKVTINSENRLADSKIRYILLKDGEEATADKSKILTDRIIDSGTIKKNKSIKYSLRIWIDSKAGDNNAQDEVMGKIFGVRLSLVADQTRGLMPTANKLCKRATTLHTETCSQTSTSLYCIGDGYTASGSMKTTTITYGNLGTKGTLTSGDAFDCDVNGDGVYDSATERFYYVSDMTNGITQDSNTAVLIYYNNVSGGVASNSTAYAYDSSGKNNNGPLTAIKQLPTTSQWKNVSLTNTTRTITNENGGNTASAGNLPTAFSYEGYAARLLTYQEVYSGCYDGTTSITSTKGLSSKCKYLMENTTYSSSSLKTYGVWLESPTASYSFSARDVYAHNRYVTVNTVDSTGYIGVRPAIEVAKTNIEY